MGNEARWWRSAPSLTAVNQIRMGKPLGREDGRRERWFLQSSESIGRGEASGAVVDFTAKKGGDGEVMASFSGQPKYRVFPSLDGTVRQAICLQNYWWVAERQRRLHPGGFGIGPKARTGPRTSKDSILLPGGTPQVLLHSPLMTHTLERPRSDRANRRSCSPDEHHPGPKRQRHRRPGEGPR